MVHRIIKDTSNQVGIDAERLKLYGVIVESDCPYCGETWKFDGNEDGQKVNISNGKIRFFAECSCGNEWSFNVTVGVKISL
jgi:hypothetical protein